MEPIQDILLYQAADSHAQLEVQRQNETVGLTQAQMAELFGRKRSAITKHLRVIFQTSELNEESAAACCSGGRKMSRLASLTFGSKLGAHHVPEF